MKGVLGLLKRSLPTTAESRGNDSMLFTSAFAELGVDGSFLVPWESRAVEIGAKRIPADPAAQKMRQLWAKDKYMGRLDVSAAERLGRFFDFAQIPADRDIIRQDEYGNFLVVLLSGTIAVDREQPWGELLRLSEARPGDMLGEMSLLDSGSRFSVCTSVTPCEVAVLGAESLDQMMTLDAPLAANLVALLARKLSQRLRVVTQRLSEHRF